MVSQISEIARDRLAIHDYILGIKTPVTVECMNPLIGEAFPVLGTRRSWGNEIVSTDRLKITAVKFTVDVETGNSEGTVMIYSDYFLDGSFLFNAWTGIESVQRYIKDHLDAKQPEQESK